MLKVRKSIHLIVFAIATIFSISAFAQHDTSHNSDEGNQINTPDEIKEYI